MKTGGSIFLWTIIVVLWFTRFAASHRDEHDYRRGHMMPTAEIVGHDDDPLTYDDVEREFARVPAADEPQPADAGPTGSVPTRDRRPPAAHRPRRRARRRLARRGDPALLDQLDEAAALDDRLREITAERDDARARVNELSKEVGQLRRAGDVDAAEALQAESRAARRRRAASSPTSTTSVADGAARPAARAPQPDPPRRPRRRVGRRQPGRPRPVQPARRRSPSTSASRTGRPATALGILDNERAIKISGSMFAMTRGLGATLGRALCQLALDRNADAFEEVRPPSLVTTATLTASGQLPKFADDAFAVERDDLWCIPTAEVPLTSLYRDEILAEADLPVRMMAATPCYRREAGLGRPGHARPAALARVRQGRDPRRRHARAGAGAARRDGRPGRGARSPRSGCRTATIEICAGDLGQSHHRSFDIEVYAPGADQWLEVSSVSWFSDYQARRANIRFRREPVDGKPRRAPRSPTRSTARRSPCPGCGRRSSRTSASPTARSLIPEVAAPVHARRRAHRRP